MVALKLLLLLLQLVRLEDATITLARAKELEKDYPVISFATLKDFEYTTPLDKELPVPNPQLEN